MLIIVLTNTTKIENYEFTKIKITEKFFKKSKNIFKFSIKLKILECANKFSKKLKNL